VPALSKRAIFLRRLASSVVLWAMVLGGLFSGITWVSDYMVLAILGLLALVGQMEFYQLVEKRGLVCFKEWGIVGGLFLMVGTFAFFQAENLLPARFTVGSINDFETCFLVLFVLGLCVRQFVSLRNPAGLLAISTTLFGLMYVPWLLNFVQKINFFAGVDGHYYLLFFVIATKFSDIGAYCTGSLIGRHKMIPRVSPGKTWEGFGGALVFSSAASLVFSQVIAPKHMPDMTWLHALVLGLMLSATAVVGDLVESLFKREAGVKDSGRLFPGIGGILDLLDSLLFNAPLMYVYMRYVMQLG
jgi:phosphatidate cytidylyltransferase